MSRIVLAGVGSGVGKTTIAAGIMRKLSRYCKVQGFKVGPDFIDTKFHEAATGRPSRNLDSFMLEPSILKNLFGWSSHDADIAIIEGVRGLYDGLTSIGDTGSTAEIAKMLDAPVILIVNARSLAKSAAAVVLGFRELDPSVRIAGVILNQISGPRHLAKAKEAVETLTGVEVLGSVSRDGAGLPEQHLGLISPDENDSLDALEMMVEDIDIDRIVEIASSASDIEFSCTSPFLSHDTTGVKIAVPLDRAYCLYYNENLEALSAAGAELVYFSPINGESLPNCDVVYLGGGYPELHAPAIADNHDFLEGIRTLSEDGGIIYGECGGLLTMCSSLEIDGDKYPMSGIFPSDAKFTRERHGPSYVRATGTLDNFLLPNHSVRGHEFHYSEVYPKLGSKYGFQVERGAGIYEGMDGLMLRKSMGTYMHLHALSCPQWAPAIIAAATD
ncbi:MAG: hydrogenobyrinic acid a,c-diamide synthase (glutamine-hydrolyzing) [Euryarchaeota archaeon]|nr:hydrogenobyrinic acid a,c-diamide synthase (glutamine-hydrolyzing) [Euryarchaeota archaeon]